MKLTKLLDYEKFAKLTVWLLIESINKRYPRSIISHFFSLVLRICDFCDILEVLCTLVPFFVVASFSLIHVMIKSQISQVTVA